MNFISKWNEKQKRRFCFFDQTSPQRSTVPHGDAAGRVMFSVLLISPCAELQSEDPRRFRLGIQTLLREACAETDRPCLFYM